MDRQWRVGGGAAAGCCSIYLGGWRRGGGADMAVQFNETMKQSVLAKQLEVKIQEQEEARQESKKREKTFEGSKGRLSFVASR
jgi:hypothetical protein